MSKSQGVNKKMVSRELAVFGELFLFWGGIEIVFLFIVVPCRPKSQKPRDVDKKLQAGYFLSGQSWVFLGQLSILG